MAECATIVAAFNAAVMGAIDESICSAHCATIVGTDKSTDRDSIRKPLHPTQYSADHCTQRIAYLHTYYGDS